MTNRALLMAALAHGESVIDGALFSDDSTYMASALRELGVGVVEDRAAARFVVRGNGGQWSAKEATLFIGNAGTAARFLVAAACLGHGTYVIDGNERMRQRPIGDLVTALRSLGIQVECETGCPPVTIHANGLPGGVVEVASGRSSQFLSALLMVAPYAEGPLVVRASDDLIARPYVDLTLAMMMDLLDTSFPTPLDYREFHLPHGKRYRHGDYRVEADASSAHYFLAAAALTGGEVTVEGVGYNSLQGDIQFATRILDEMGARVVADSHAITVSRSSVLRGGDFNMNAISDTSMTLAVLGVFASEPVRIRNVAHIRGQESDRIAAMTTELKKLGANIEEFADGWRITPTPLSELHGAELDTYDDHRIAMALSLAGLKIPEVILRDPGCVSKTYPGFFDDLDRLRRIDVVAIDGPAGAGKSSVSRAVAQALGYRYVDTGAMYRIIGFLAQERGIAIEDAPGLAALCDATSIAFEEGPQGIRVLADGRDVSREIRSAEAGQWASKISTVAVVRERLVALQRRLAEGGGVVMEGRDIGTVVCPDAAVKVYLDASSGERARRRAAELEARGESIDLERMTRDIEERDARDSGRQHSPLKPAPDAVHIDTTNLSLAAVIDQIRQMVRATGRP